MPRLSLSKLHATGNDFLVLLDPDNAQPGAGASARLLCDRNRGIGADGLIRVSPGTAGADLTFQLWNADGGEAEMSGNGSRCVAFAAVRAGLVPHRFTLATGGGVRTVEFAETDSAAAVAFARTEMGPATVGETVKLEAGDAALEGDLVTIGNPHFVVFVDDVDDSGLVADAGDLSVRHSVNVEVVTPTADGLTMRVWERGVGETMSCGTGACASSAAANRRGLVGDRVLVRVRGGELTVDLSDTIWLGGPVAHAFDIEVDTGHLEAGAGA